MSECNCAVDPMNPDLPPCPLHSPKALRARLAALEAERDEARRQERAATDALYGLSGIAARAAAAESRVSVLEEALRGLVTGSVCEEIQGDWFEITAPGEVVRTARVALASSGTPGSSEGTETTR
jgi:hypothetical protein